MIRTPQGHEIVFDDTVQSIKVTTSTDHQITLEPQQIEIASSDGSTSVTLDTSGRITIKAGNSIDLQASTISLQGKTINIKGSQNVSLTGGSVCDIQASVVKIN